MKIQAEKGGTMVSERTKEKEMLLHCEIKDELKKRKEWYEHEYQVFRFSGCEKGSKDLRADFITRSHVIEVKYSLTLNTLYKAIGQVLLYREAINSSMNKHEKLYNNCNDKLIAKIIYRYTNIEDLNQLKQLAENQFEIEFEKRDSQQAITDLMKSLKKFNVDLDLTKLRETHHLDLDSLIDRLDKIYQLTQGLDCGNVKNEIETIQAQLKTELDPNKSQNKYYYIGKKYQTEKRPHGGHKAKASGLEKTEAIIANELKEKYRCGGAPRTIRRYFDYSKHIDTIKEYLGEGAYIIVIKDIQDIQEGAEFGKIKNLANLLTIACKKCNLDA